MRKNNYIHLLAFLCLVSLATYPTISHAQNEGEQQKTLDAREVAEAEMKKNENKVKWEIHRSVTNIFETKFPKEYKYKIFPFQFNNDTIAFTVEILSSLDDIKSDKKEKSILISAVQTFGDELTYRDVDNIIKREVRKYKQSAHNIDGVLLTNEDIVHKGFSGKNIYISYTVDGKKYGLRILLLITNYSKIEHVLSGPGHTMYSYRSDDFFDSIKVYDGITKKENPIGVGWIDYTSPNNIFTVKLPPKNSDYTPSLPKFSATPTKGKMRFVITDPVLAKDVTYNVYSYKNKGVFSRKAVKTILFSKHISKFVKNASIDTLKTEDTTVGDMKTMRTKLIITPTEVYPDITTIFFEAKYKGDTLIIQEFLSSKKHANSGLNKTLFSLMKFHPEKYKAVEMPIKKTPAEKAK